MLVRYCTADALKNHERANAFNLVLLVLNNFIKNLFATKSIDYKSLLHKLQTSKTIQ